MIANEPLIPKHGGYRKLKSFQVAQLIYDITVRFCDSYIEKRSRTHDQMVQAARSGVQNIAEGSQASGTSKKTELKLTSVARASLEELRLDYEDFLRQRGLLIWDRNDPRRQGLIDRRCATADELAQWVREEHDRGQKGFSGRGGQSSGHGGQNSSTPSTVAPLSTTSTSPTISTPTFPEITANAALVLLVVACSLLDRQLAAQAKAFETEGGFTERLYRMRSEKRSSRFSSTQSTPSTKSTKD
ncbi:MAG: four helix bundle suffix domain-containing protein [Proteobacteria bacterium]|nr:four helix bundle suffix domain-containing protein [Pseudomonadota bacterium]